MRRVVRVFWEFFPVSKDKKWQLPRGVDVNKKRIISFFFLLLLLVGWLVEECDALFVLL